MPRTCSETTIVSAYRSATRPGRKSPSALTSRTASEAMPMRARTAAGRAQALLHPVRSRLLGAERYEPDRDQASGREESPSDDGRRPMPRPSRGRPIQRPPERRRLPAGRSRGGGGGVPVTRGPGFSTTAGSELLNEALAGQLFEVLLSSPRATLGLEDTTGRCTSPSGAVPARTVPHPTATRPPPD